MHNRLKKSLDHAQRSESDQAGWRTSKSLSSAGTPSGKVGFMIRLELDDNKIATKIGHLASGVAGC